MKTKHKRDRKPLLPHSVPDEVASRSLLLHDWFLGLLVVEWIFVVGVYIVRLFYWFDWLIMNASALVILHLSALVNITFFRNYTQWAEAFLREIHAWMVFVAIADLLTFAAFWIAPAADVLIRGEGAVPTGGGGVSVLDTADGVARLVVLSCFVLFGWIKVILVFARPHTKGQGLSVNA